MYLRALKSVITVQRYKTTQQNFNKYIHVILLIKQLFQIQILPSVIKDGDGFEHVMRVVGTLFADELPHALENKSRLVDVHRFLVAAILEEPFSVQRRRKRTYGIQHTCALSWVI